MIQFSNSVFNEFIIYTCEKLKTTIMVAIFEYLLEIYIPNMNYKINYNIVY